jgi:hypothetical protein
MPKLKDPNVWFQNARRVTDDPAASDWLKNALLEAINRDPVDAAGDAEVLCRILKQRAAVVQKGSERPSTTRSSPKAPPSARIESKGALSP